MYDGLILKGTRIIIPTSLKPVVLQKLHYAHQGAEKCKLRAKGSVFWANINRDIKEMVKSCIPCQRPQNINVKEPLIAHDVPQKPWDTLGSDLFDWNDSSYLIVSDYYSKFPLVRRLSNNRSATTIAHLKSIFEEFGIPNKLVTGNDTQFTSTAFQDFSKTYGFTHVTTSPYYSQSNGLIERTVETVKNLFTKCKESGCDPHLAMLCLRSTPIDHASPAELLNKRVYKGNLPAISKPGCSSDGDVNFRLQERQNLQKKDYDRSAGSVLPALSAGDPVRVLNTQSRLCEPGVIAGADQAPRSYVVAMSKGGMLTRNRRHLRPTGEKIVTGDNTSTGPQESDPPGPEAPLSLRRSARHIKPPERLDL